MKGKLHKTDNGWVVKYKDILNLFPITQTGMKEVSLHPTYEKYYFLDEDAEGGEVEFEIITIDNGDNGVRYAKLQPKRTGKMTEEEWVAAENNLKPKYTPGKGISFYITNEISDQEIKKGIKREWNYSNYQDRHWIEEGAKWYREQLRIRNEKK